VLEEFPPFDPGFAISENGIAEGKMNRTDLPGLGESFRALDQLFGSAEFISFVEEITQIRGLIFDPSYYGGGIHCSVAGQELDPHLDFNLHPIEEKLLRRVNVLLYLNPGWDPERGGDLELYADPRDSDPGRMKRIAPLANRLVIFETNERSWHGHDRIKTLASDAPRRSVAVYYYTDVRDLPSPPAPHQTIYADRPLIGGEGLEALAAELEKRKAHFKRILRVEEDLLVRAERLARMLRERLDSMDPAAGRESLESQISCLDLAIASGYEREKAVRSAIQSLTKEVSVLDFFKLAPLPGDGKF
jgi:hypothetical protein